MTQFAILGGGRLARHMRHYFSLLHLPHTCWARNPSAALNTHAIPDTAERLSATVDTATHVLLLVSDGALAGLVKRYPVLRTRMLVHCSGALGLPGIAGAHPLMTFSGHLYTLDQYRAIPFMVDSGHDFADLLPGLPNPHFSVPLEQKARYHALCVMAGNFSQVLWQTVSRRFEAMGLPAATLAPYLKQVVANFAHDPGTALTGPLTRGDWNTIERNLQALGGDTLEPLYRAFLGHWSAERPAGTAREVAS
jgi:2-dehydropantoate 2-reductase